MSVLVFAGQQVAGSLIGEVTRPAFGLVADTVRDTVHSLRGQPPVEVRVENWTNEYALTRPIRQVGSPPIGEECTGEGYVRWVQQRLAPPGLHAQVSVRVTAKTTKTTVYRGVEVRTLDRRPSTRRTALACQAGDAPGEGVHIVSIQLDRGRANIQYFDDQYMPRSHGTTPLTRDKEEFFEFWVAAATAEEYDWDFELLFSVDGRPYRYRVQNAGHPFRVAGLPADTRWYGAGPHTDWKWEQNGTGAIYRRKDNVWTPAR